MRMRQGFLAVTALVTMLAGAARADEAADHYNLGLQLKHEGKNAEAIAEMEKAIKARSDYAAAYFSLGNLWRAPGGDAQAATALGQAGERPPQGPAAPAHPGPGFRRPQGRG